MNNVAWLAFEIGVNVFQGFMLAHFHNRVLTPKFKSSLPSIICALLIGAGCSLYLFYDIRLIDTWVFSIPLCYALLCFTDSFKLKLFWTLIQVAVFLGVANLCTFAFTVALDISTAQLMQENSLRIVYVGTSNLALFLALYTISRRQHSGFSNTLAMVLFVVSNIVVILIIDMLFLTRKRQQIDDTLFLLISALMLCISVISVFLYEIMSSFAQRDFENQRRQDQIEMQNQRFEELRSIYTSLNSFKHDFKNQVQIAYQMIEDGRAEESKAHLCKMENQMYALFATGCFSLDSLLTLKELDMRRRGIRFEYSLCSLMKLPISDYDLCGVVGNLLDNAIEALVRQDLKKEQLFIEFRIDRVRDMLFVECVNPADDSAVRREKNVFVTSKRGEGHGLGIQSVRGIVRQAGGTSSFTCENGRFSVVITLPYESEG